MTHRLSPVGEYCPKRIWTWVIQCHCLNSVLTKQASCLLIPEQACLQGENVSVRMKRTSGLPDSYITHCKLMHWLSGFLCPSPVRCTHVSQCPWTLGPWKIETCKSEGLTQARLEDCSVKFLKVSVKLNYCPWRSTPKQLFLPSKPDPRVLRQCDIIQRHQVSLGLI